VSRRRVLRSVGRHESPALVAVRSSCRIITLVEAGRAPGRQVSMPADAGVEIAWEMAEEFGAPTLEHYRRVYAACGVPWPGDDEVCRLLPVAAQS
jgi:hypothetical protein